MVIYLISYISALLVSLLSTKLIHDYHRTKKAGTKVLFVFSFILAFLCFEIPSALRYGVGTDFNYTYMPTLTYMMEHDGVIPDYDPLVKIIYQLIWNYKLPVQFFFVASSFFINLFFFLAIYQNRNGNYWMGISIYFLNCIFYASLSNVRQFMGVAVVVFGFAVYFNHPNDLKGVLTGLISVLLGFLCHKSCLIYLAVFLLFVILRTRKSVYLASGLLLAFSPILSVVGVKLISDTSYAYFLTSFASSSIAEGNFVMILPEVFLLVFSLMSLKEEDDRLVYFPVITSTLSLMVLIFTCIYPNAELFLRLYHFFYVFDIIYLPYVIEKTREDYRTRQAAQVVLLDEESVLVPMKELSVLRVHCGERAKGITILMISSYSLAYLFEEIVKSLYEVIPYQSILHF